MNEIHNVIEHPIGKPLPYLRRGIVARALKFPPLEWATRFYPPLEGAGGGGIHRVIPAAWRTFRISSLYVPINFREYPKLSTETKIYFRECPKPSTETKIYFREYPKPSTETKIYFREYPKPSTETKTYFRECPKPSIRSSGYFRERPKEGDRIRNDDKKQKLLTLINKMYENKN